MNPPSTQSSELKFEIGHVLFIDIVGYSKLLINEQSEQIQKLTEIVRGTEQFRLAEAEGKLLRLPTGDGGALVFPKQLNPNHPDWYWYANFHHSYRQKEYLDALSFLLKADLPGHWGMQAGSAATYGQLGKNAAAAKALGELLKLRPDFAATARKELQKWWNLEFVEDFISGCRKAGLEIPTTA